jgi:hypothetical protein
VAGHYLQQTHQSVAGLHWTAGRHWLGGHCGADGPSSRRRSRSCAAAGPPRPGRLDPAGWRRPRAQAGPSDQAGPSGPNGRTVLPDQNVRTGRRWACGQRPGPASRRLVARALLRPPLTPTLRTVVPAHSTSTHRRTTCTVNTLRAATSKVAALSAKMSGGVLLSHAVPRAVPSALKGLTSGFGMGPGVSPSPWPPKLYGDVRPRTFRNGYARADRISGTAQWTQAISIGRSQATRPISTGQLHTSPCFHLRPINPVV